jgi:ubiquinone/menaquinone biosynthesis C-methylase UbiE
MSSISFDPVAHKYDATRGYPEEVTQQVAESIDRAANGNTQTRFFEVGVGTGRYAVPIASLGRQYTGVDISEKMLGLLLEKLRTGGWQEELQAWGSVFDEDTAQKPDVLRFTHQETQGTLRLLLADATKLPFRSASFDVVLVAHVFHLISEWRQALQEVLRVLRPGGVLIRCWNENWAANWEPGAGDLKREWSAIVEDLGGTTKLPGAADKEVTAWLQAQGLQTELWERFSFKQETSRQAIFQEIEQRLWTSAQLLPDHIFKASMERLRLWVDEHYGAHIADTYIEERQVVISRTQL